MMSPEEQYDVWLVCQATRADSYLERVSWLSQIKGDPMLAALTTLELVEYIDGAMLLSRVAKEAQRRGEE